MQSIALVTHVLLAIGVIGLVLIQHGKGADAGAAFGSGASATVFGARGSASFLTRATTILAVLFFLTSLALFYLAAHRDSTVRSVTEGASVVEEVPAVPAAGDLPGGVDGETLDLPVAPPGGDAIEEGAAADPTTSVDVVPAPGTAPASDEDLPPPAD